MPRRQVTQPLQIIGDFNPCCCHHHNVASKLTTPNIDISCQSPSDCIGHTHTVQGAIFRDLCKANECNFKSA